MWHKQVMEKLRATGLFEEVILTGAQVRASIDKSRFLDVYFDPTTESYSYALIDLTLPYSGDKRVFGWDDYPHESVTEIEQLESYPHHFQRRSEDGSWIFEDSPMRGTIVDEIDIVIVRLREYLM